MRTPSRPRPTELHPEDLLERDVRGELSAGEGAQLEAHLARCAACRLERMVRVDFLREAEADAPHTPADVQRLLAGALDAPRAPETSAPPTYRRHRFAGLLLAGVFVAATGWAAAARWTGPNAAATTFDAAEGPLVGRRAAPRPSGPARGEDAPVAVRDVPLEQAAPALPATAREPTPRPTPAVRPLSLVSTTAAPPAAESPGLAFQQANEARRAGQHTRAAETYRALVARYPASPEASASLVALGRMLLDDGDAPGALQCFDGYLRRGGAMGEDVMLGRALALQRLGRSDDESGAWNALLASYPASVHAARARRRLLDLGKL
ncbi:MAG TPA: tetratricopeptide repeat protein [Polyangiaceae bacterium]|jgi:TolA-binding protein